LLARRKGGKIIPVEVEARKSNILEDFRKNLRSMVCRIHVVVTGTITLRDYVSEAV